MVVGAGCVGVVAGGAVGVVMVGVAVVGGRTSGSDFSPQPAKAAAAAATAAATMDWLRRPPAFDRRFTPRNLTLLIFGGVAVALLLRRPIELAARRWRQARLELERERPPLSAGAPSQPESRG